MTLARGAPLPKKNWQLTHPKKLGNWPPTPEKISVIGRGATKKIGNDMIT
jgi:hypothetical protein